MMQGNNAGCNAIASKSKNPVADEGVELVTKELLQPKVNKYCKQRTERRVVLGRKLIKEEKRCPKVCINF